MRNEEGSRRIYIKRAAFNIHGVKGKENVMKALTKAEDICRISDTWIKPRGLDLMDSVQEHTSATPANARMRGYGRMALAINPIMKYKIQWSLDK